MKGYIETLEHRLDATENILSRLLSTVDDAAIDSAFKAEAVPKTSLSSMIADASGRTEGARAAMIGHWEQHPLHTAEDVRAWVNSSLVSLEKTRSVDMASDLSDESVTGADGQFANDSSTTHSALPISPSSAPGTEIFSPNTLHGMEPVLIPTGTFESSQISQEGATQKVPYEKMTNKECVRKTHFHLPDDFANRYIW